MTTITQTNLQAFDRFATVKKCSKKPVAKVSEKVSKLKPVDGKIKLTEINLDCPTKNIAHFWL